MSLEVTDLSQLCGLPNFPEGQVPGITNGGDVLYRTFTFPADAWWCRGLDGVVPRTSCRHADDFCRSRNSGLGRAVNDHFVVTGDGGLVWQADEMRPEYVFMDEALGILGPRDINDAATIAAVS